MRNQTAEQELEMAYLYEFQKIIPHIWFENEALDAAHWYVSIFRDSRIRNNVILHDTPSGDADIVTLTLWGQNFQFISAGKLFSRNPSFSYMIACSTAEEVEGLWIKLSEGGDVLMPLDKYDFSLRYGWLRDKYGVSWQIMHNGGMQVQRITPALMFTGEVCGRAEEAMEYYISINKNAALLPGHLSRYGKGQAPDREGNINYARFTLSGREFVVMESARVHDFYFNEMQSLIIYCDTQEEIDYYWKKLSRVPDAEQCGWIKDQFGISWQIVPRIMDEMMNSGTENQIRNITEAFLKMKKFDIAALKKAYNS